MTLHVETWGRGGPIVLVHGSFGWGAETWEAQRELGDAFELRVFDRRGYGDSPRFERVDFESQVDDIVHVLGDGAHLVGQSFGGLLALLAAAREPKAVRSLVVVEPAAFSTARGHPAVERLIRRLDRWYELAACVPRERLYPAFLESLGIEPDSPELGERNLAAAEATAREPAPWKARVPLEDLAAAPFPTLVVSGAWDVAARRAREIAATALWAVCEVLERRLDAERAVFSGAMHNPQLLGGPFNDRLRTFFSS